MPTKFKKVKSIRSLTMDLSRKLIEKEIVGSEAALKAHKEGVLIHEIVLAALRQELDKLGDDKPEED